jgi:DamX protein
VIEFIGVNSPSGDEIIDSHNEIRLETEQSPTEAVANDSATSSSQDNAEDKIDEPVKEVAAASPKPDPIPAPQTAPVPKPVTEKAPAPTAPAKPAAIDIEQQLIAQIEEETELNADEEKLLAQPVARYALQVLAGASRESIDSFVSTQSNRDQLMVYSALRNGKTLYIVLVGTYANADQARAAIQTLPAGQQKGGPWPRSLESVQADIRAFRGL